MNASKRKIMVGVTGASGAIYAERFIEQALKSVERVYLVATRAGTEVVNHELKPHVDQFSLKNALAGELSEAEKRLIRIYRIDDFFSPIASGSSVPTDMVILPCSMGTLARVATGMSTNLLDRAADVVLKEKKRLVICPRETPLNTIHLRNMLTLSEMGAYIVPPMPAFYNKPKDLDAMIDFIVGRVCDCLDLPHDLYSRWNTRMS